MHARLVFAAAAFAASSATLACDLCAVHSANQALGHGDGLYGAVAQQFTRYDELRREGEPVDDDEGQYLDSSVTQLVAGYGFSERWGVQVSIPYIIRSYERPLGNALEEGREDGLGDVSLVGQLTPLLHRAEATTLSVRLHAGVKLPTGDTRRLQEEIPHSVSKHEEGDHNGIHGHDLALGSGSVDVLLGASTYGRIQRWTAAADLQYAYRRKGDFEYRYGDDLIWSVAAGGYLMLRDDATLALQAAVEGEYKEYDDLGGVELDDTHSGIVMVGPRALLTGENRYAVDLAALFPVQQYNSALQTTAGFRVRLALGYRF